jgi:hypothetical protein
MKNTPYPHEIIKKQVGNSKVELVGVTHTSEFFNSHRKFYERKIEESPEGIILEQPINFEFWEKPGDNRFYSHLGEIAYRNKINVYQTDPINIKSTVIDYSLFLPGTELLSKGTSKKSIKMTRKEFLKRLGLSFSGASIVYGSFIPYAYVKTLVGEIPKVDFFSYGGTDWRNVKIAEGIEKICEKENPKKLTAFHGAGHTKQIEAYLNNTKIREMKNVLYAPLNFCGIKGARKYIPDKFETDFKKYNQSWKLEEII